MKKKIGDLTLKEVVDICKKCDEEKIDYCPFANAPVLHCVDNDKVRRFGLYKEIEVEENEKN